MLGDFAGHRDDYDADEELGDIDLLGHRLDGADKGLRDVGDCRGRRGEQHERGHLAEWRVPLAGGDAPSGLRK